MMDSKILKIERVGRRENSYIHHLCEFNAKMMGEGGRRERKVLGMRCK
jgi:hypothetical protein